MKLYPLTKVLIQLYWGSIGGIESSSCNDVLFIAVFFMKIDAIKTETTNLPAEDEPALGACRN
ncbi:hypothetical protein [Evansella tamaricis]|uniref:Uncharacterized protein n=1 Tax=Evansella tamaricis TaxID=2069301 RepID=A0ABS6JBZ2_9BACI|nr:hypothetical protein [Evansella tamaricis]MBU9710709.1 hypothetical protein [Evansella tamaricis]